MLELDKYKNFNILYVEDESMIRKSVEQCLNYFFNVVSAKDGQEGLNYFLSKEIDLIITDLNMPNKNGLTMLENIREKCNLTPCVITSSLSTDLLEKVEKIENCSYISKPFDVKALIQTSINILEQRV